MLLMEAQEVAQTAWFQGRMPVLLILILLLL